MSISTLEAALTSLDTTIATLTAQVVAGYSIEGLSVTRRRLKDAIEARQMLDKVIRDDGSNLYQVESRLVP